MRKNIFQIVLLLLLMQIESVEQAPTRTETTTTVYRTPSYTSYGYYAPVYYTPVIVNTYVPSYYVYYSYNTAYGT